MKSKYTIEKEFHFSASHQLSGLPETHPCSRLHGHNYVISFTLSSSYLDDTGFVKDYRELDEVKKYLDETFDHRHINDIVNFNPTAESIAEFLYLRFKGKYPQLTRVSVKETPKTIAHYETESE